ncbi:MAG TPA: XdhC family protein [Polyangiaceae bacterium]|nr:XdhC family protein [Polyangiaceae bacterium]
MSEIAAVCRAWLAAARASEPTWLATVARVDGSSYRRPGARLLFSRDTVLAGALSAGCLERELVRMGPWLARNGPVAKIVDSRSDEDDGPREGTGCHGKLEIMLEPLTAVADAALAVLGRELEAERRVALATVIDDKLAPVPLGARVVRTEHALVSQVRDDSLTRVLSGALDAALGEARAGASYVQAGSSTVLVEVLEPAPRLFVFGTGADVVPVVGAAALLGWNVTVCGKPGQLGARERFMKLGHLSEQPLADNVAALDGCARPLAVVMSHDYAADRSALAALLGTDVPYIGVLGPARRTERMLAEIGAERGGIAPARRACVFGPAGLALGAETSAEIALSIVAEAQAALAGATRDSLRERSGTIHEPVALVLQGEAS